MSYVLIIGAKSDIAKAVAREYAKHGYHLYLAARDVEVLESFSNDLKIRYEKDIRLLEFDITDFTSHQSFYDSLEVKPQGAIVVSGYMTEQNEAQVELAKTLNTINVNYTGAVSILNTIANDFETRQSGFIVGVSSVAGDRGRKTNYIYGSAKAGFSAYLSGLRNRLHQASVNVLTVKPGFVDTKMTEHLDLPKKLTAQSQEVAEAIFKAQQKNKNIVYIKTIWFFIMLVIKHIPEFIFKKMSI